MKLHFGAAPACNMFQKKKKTLFKDIHNFFGIADDILIVEFDADDRGHGKRLEQL